MASNTGSVPEEKARPPAYVEASVQVEGWRRPIGIGLFVLHLILPLLALVLVPILGLRSGTNAILMGVSVV